MADDGFNGSTVTFNGAGQTPLRSITFDCGGAMADVSGAGDSQKTYVAGLDDPKVTFVVCGATALSRGGTGGTAGLVIAWNDGDSDGTLTAAIISSVSVAGSMDGEILSTIEVVPKA